MPCECPDSRFFGDLTALNRDFLELLRHPGAPPSGRALGLETACVSALGQLSETELTWLAKTPCLLAEFVPRRHRVSEPGEPSIAQQGGRWGESVRLYSVALLSFMRGIAQDDRLLAALCFGPAADAQDRYATMTLNGIGGRASLAAAELHARYSRSGSFWPDLIRAARSDNPEYRQLSRLTALPLSMSTMIEATPPSR